MTYKPSRPTRRQIVALSLGGVASTLLACSDDDAVSGGEPRGAAGTSGSSGNAGSSGSAAVGQGGAAGGGGGGAPAQGDAAGSGGVSGAAGAGEPTACTLYPQQAEGPFYLDAASVRRDITEGLPGVRLTLSLRILRAGDCAASSGVAVDIWQCDADGVYSGYPGQLGGRNTSGEQFLRGTQVTDAEGVATFETIYPGWYPGRTTHIHFKVRATDPEDAASFREATSQLYFPEDVTALVYQSAPYASRGQKDTSNAADGLSRNELPPLLAVAQAGDGYTASLTVSIAL